MDGILLFSGPFSQTANDPNHTPYSDFLYVGLEQASLVVKQLNGQIPVNISLAGSSPLNASYSF
jgi:hypothetical protein